MKDARDSSGTGLTQSISVCVSDFGLDRFNSIIVITTHIFEHLKT